MLRIIQKKHAGIQFAIILIVLLFLNTIVRAQYPPIRNIGDLSVNLSFVLMYGFLLKSWMDRKRYEYSLIQVYIFWVLFAAVFTISYIFTDYASGNEFLRIFSLLILILGFIRYKWNDLQVRVIGYLFGFVTILFFVQWIVNDFPVFGFKGIFTNQNYLAVVLFSMLFFNILTIKYSHGIERAIFSVFLILNGFMMIMTSARSVMVASAVIMLSWVILKQYRRLFPYLIYIILFGNALFMLFYVGIKGTAIGAALNQVSRSVFNKNLFSGRSELWEGLMYAIAEQPLFGYGIGVRAKEIIDTHYTAHNLYLQLMLETGIVGLFVFFIFILMIWKVLNRQLDNFASKWSACFLLGILVYEIFELTLFQNNFPISMIQWLIITFGINFFVINPDSRNPYMGRSPGDSAPASTYRKRF